MKRCCADEINIIKDIIDKDILFINGNKHISDICFELINDHHSEAIITRGNTNSKKVFVHDIIGIVDLDIVKRSQVHYMDLNEPIKSLASADFYTIDVDKTIRDAKLLMKLQNCDKLIITEEEEVVVGIITVLDILKSKQINRRDLCYKNKERGSSYLHREEDLYLKLKDKQKELIRLKKELEEIRTEQYDLDNIPRKSQSLENAVRLAKNVAQTDVSVLINGEKGVGKSYFAKAIHTESRRNGKFISINCNIDSEELLESRIFGNGVAYHDAEENMVSAFCLAEGGTLFLEEVDALPSSIQSKLAKVIDTGYVNEVSGKKQTKINTRIIASTSKDLGDILKSNNFIEKLYFQLCNVLIFIPPLRERKEDIPELIECFILEAFTKAKKGSVKITQKAVETLSEYSWEGNESQLKNVIERLVLLSKGNIINNKDIIYNMSTVEIDSYTDLKDIYNINLKDAVEDFERKIIMNALDITQGNKTKAAELLKVKRSTLHYKLNMYDLLEYSPRT